MTSLADVKVTRLMNIALMSSALKSISSSGIELTKYSQVIQILPLKSLYHFESSIKKIM